MGLRVYTNNIPRDIRYGGEMPESKRSPFEDYLKEEELWEYRFVEYKGEWYDLNDMEVSTIEGWDAMVTETFFSGILVKYTSDYEQVIMGRYYS